jgi:hypothetical protein
MPKYKTKLLGSFPALLAQAHPKKNGSIDVSSLSSGSSVVIWWKCVKGSDHEWEATVRSRTRGNGCPFCAGKRLSVTNSLAALFPEVAKQLHPSMNIGVTADKVLAGTKKAYWWRCPKSNLHDWAAPVRCRTYQGQDCPFCAGKRIAADNSLEAIYPEIAAEFDIKRNGKSSSDILPNSHQKYWWKCPKNSNHSWAATPNNRVSNKSGCPICSGNAVSPETSLAKNYPKIAAEWHPSRNGDLTPSDVTVGSGRPVWWKCPKGPDHEWRTLIKNRVKGDKCPFCSGKKPSVTNSLASLFPDIALQLHPERNKNMTAHDIVAGSHTRYWWKCDKGSDHEWRAAVKSRTLSKQNCPCCAGQKVSVTNSLQSLYPAVAREFHPEKNGTNTPGQIIAMSGKKYWWRCSVNPTHEWRASSHNRVRGSGCPYCIISPRSKEEILLAFELRHFVPFDIAAHKVRVREKIIDVDMLLEKEKIIVEYDGSHWHREKGDIDRFKANSLMSQGWTVIRVREAPLKALSEHDVTFPIGDLKTAANQLLQRMTKLTGKPSKKVLHNYLRRTKLINDKEAQKYILSLLNSGSLTLNRSLIMASNGKRKE